MDSSFTMPFQLLSPQYTSRLLPLTWLTMSTDSGTEILLILNKLIFVGVICSLFVLGQLCFLTSPCKHFPILPYTYTVTTRRQIQNDICIYTSEFEKKKLKEKKLAYRASELINRYPSYCFIFFTYNDNGI